jgi:DNA-binding beta-propeller fold protein YncE
MSPKELNFAGPHPRLRLLQAGVVAALSACGVMVWMLMGGSLPRGVLTAVIGEQSAEPTLTTTPEPTPAPTPILLASEPAHNIAVLSTDIVRVAEEETGRVLLLDVQGTASTVESDRRIPDYLDTFWFGSTPNRIVLTDKAGVPQFRRVLADGALDTPLENGTMSIAVSPDGTRVARVVREPLQTTIRVSVAGNDDDATLLQSRIQDPVIGWADATTISLLTKRPDRDGWDLSLLDDEGVLTPLITNREGLEVLWAPTGSRALVSYVTDEGIVLSVLDRSSGSMVPLGIETSVRKCAFSPEQDSIVCGIPTSRALSRDAAADRTATNDAIAVISLESGISRTVMPARDAVRFSVIDPAVTASGRFLVFRNLYDRKVYGLPIR